MNLSGTTAAKDLLEKASLYIRRKIPQTGHLMCPRRLWLQTTPAESDVMIAFPADVEVALLDWLLVEIRRQTPGLQLSIKRTSLPGSSYGIYCSATYDLLLQCADKLHVMKPLLPSMGGGTKEFSYSEAEYFIGVQDEGTFLTSQERQAFILDLLNNVRFDPGRPSPFPYHSIRWHEGQPMNLICNYFGVKIAFYFAWLGHYTTALLLPGIAGLAYWCGFCNAGDQVSEDAGFVLLAVVNVIWATVFLEAWKRKEKELAYKWGTLDQRDELLTDPRPMYTGPIEVSPVTGILEPCFAPWKRNVVRYVFSFPLMLFCLTVVSGVMWTMLQIQDYWDDYLEKSFPYLTVASYIPKVIMALLVTFFDWIYKHVAVWLNDLENYRGEEHYQNHLIVKLVLFQFVNSFVALFYVAFYLRDMEKLRDLLFAMLIIRQIIGNIKESAVPYIVEQLRIAKLSFDLFGALSPTKDESFDEEPFCGSTAESSKVRQRKRRKDEEKEPSRSSTPQRTVSQAELELQMPKYDGTFEDYSELFIQFGYVAFFSSAFPLASLWALFNNIIEIRTDAFKLCYVLQRPFGERVQGIGAWQDAMEWMGIIAILVNCALIGQSGQIQRIFPDLPPHGTFVLIILLEHVMLILRGLLRYCIPDIPSWIATEMAKIEFSRRTAARNIKMESTRGHAVFKRQFGPARLSYLHGVRSQSLDRTSPT